jgi:hypothetical protein
MSMKTGLRDPIAFAENRAGGGLDETVIKSGLSEGEEAVHPSGILRKLNA